MKNAERYIPEAIVASCLVMPRGGAKGIFASAVAETAGSAARATSDTIAALKPVATGLGVANHDAASSE